MSRRRWRSRAASRARQRPVWVRFVLVPGLTDDRRRHRADRDVRRRARQRRAGRCAAVHQLGRFKWEKLGIPYTADLLVIVLIADAAQNGLGKEYSSVTEGLALVVTIVAWEYLLDWLAWRFPATRPYLKPASLTLIRDGRLIPQNLRREMITEDELKSQLREQSVESYEDIKLATLEGDGRLSVLKRN